MEADISMVLAWDLDLPRFRGKVYRLKQPDQAMKAAYEGLMKQKAMEECIAASRNLPADEKEYNRRLILTDLRTGKYRWGGPFWQESMQSEQGMLMLIQLMLHDKDNRPVPDALLQSMTEDDEFSPWLIGAVYVACGTDPTLALALAKATVAEAKKTQAGNQSNLKQIIDDLLAKSSPNALSSGDITPALPTGKSTTSSVS